MSENKQNAANTRTSTEDSVRSPLVTDLGTTTIAENVVAKLTGIAAREVPGVYGLGNAARRAFDTLTDRIPGSQTNVSGGVSVEKGEKQTAIDLTIVVEYGTAIVEVAEAIRRNVIRAVENGTGLQVVEVNIDVTDVHLPEDDEEESAKDSPELS
ncbi:Asp23/Gls24 family envelope stress response protein [Brevibacterium spongiae]|uniref:Asp23/Gls24 family envelope stress response protein n=1 Tax=Brevibacterium spongiae TaxID=2909672 RepID=A0ABY5SNR7_9MICO|nr:Asp23/Gls24 family envelope stress response protein [Brevibacterium spongiae]UVI35804.1 Asp23/Gls24 family envelope stress response protein [Brevibacterium spongiae]